MLKNNSGIVLIGVIIFGVIILLFSISLAGLSILEKKSDDYFNNETKAFYVAKSGVELSINQLDSLSGDELALISYPYVVTGTIDGNPYTASITRSGDDLIIECTGVVNGIDDTVKVKMKANKITAPVSADVAIFAKSTITSYQNGDNVVITGDVGTNMLEELNPIDLANASVGNLYYDLNRTYPDVSQDMFISSLPVGTQNLTVNDSSTILSNKSYNNLTLNNGAVLYIDTTSGDITIRTNELILGNNSSIELLGDNNVEIYVDSVLNLENECNINNGGNVDRVKLIYSGTTKQLFDNNMNNYCHFISDTAEVEFRNDSWFQGNIFSNTNGSITIDSNTTAVANVLYSPNSSVYLKNNCQLQGAIICNEASIGNGSNITFLNANSGYMPIDNEVIESYSTDYWH